MPDQYMPDHLDYAGLYSTLQDFLEPSTAQVNNGHYLCASLLLSSKFNIGQKTTMRKKHDMVRQGAA